MSGVYERIGALVLGGLMAVTATTTEVEAQDGYLVRPGDVLRIEVLQDPGLNRSTLVTPDGNFAFPLAGSVTAAGRTLEQVQTDLSNQLAANFAAPPNIFISVEQVAVPQSSGTGGGVSTIEIFVMGEAAQPGKLDVKRGTTVLQAFAQMGGFSPFAATKRVQLHRNGKIYTLNYDAIEDGSSTNGSTKLQDGDVIVVPQRRLLE
jgi:polysaccharide export outer membrane protein